jgi:S-DNA-T family DNA segregation ATPase FtsK/SpoIIIE
LIVIDEFAALVTELPQFVDGMVDIAQRGRALGLHLVLATQKPAGVVSEKIRANTNLRVALRMSDEADSMDVIGLSDAAHIPRTIPGRGFVRLGHGEVTEFQSPFASAPALTGLTENLAIRMLGPTGVLDERADVEPGTSTQLGVLVDAIVRAGAGFQPQPSPVLPALPNVLSLEDLGPTGPGRFPVGLMDEPAAQRQQPFELDFDNDGSVLVYGTGGSGKTTLLRTIAASIAMHSAPESTHIYALDLGTRGLSVLTALPHCGSVIFADEEERIRRLFGMVRDEIDHRRSTSPSAEVPTLIVLLDGYAGFAAAFERVEFGEMVDALPRLIADGRQVGIHFVITADRRGAVPAAVTGIIANRIVLRLADDDEYAAFGLSSGPDREALSTRGRAFLGTGILVQCAVPGKGASVTEQIEVIRDLGASIETRSAPAPVRTLPDQLDATELPAPEDRGTIPVGFDERFDVVACDLTDSHMLIAGPRRSGRSTSLATIAFQVSRTQNPPPVHLLLPRARAADATAAPATVTTGLEACEAWIRTSREALAREKAIVLIDDGDELFDVLAADDLQATLRWARDNDVRFVIAVESHAAHRAFGGWIAELKKEKHGLLLDPEVDVDGDLLSARLPRRKASFPPGRGYFVSRGESRLIQVARSVPARDSAVEPDPAPQP